MGRLLRTLVPFLCFLISPATYLVAQNYLYGTGNQTWGINIPIENGYINVANGEVHLEIDLATHKQRGSLALDEKLVYDSRIWQIIPTGSSYSFQPTNVPNSQAGWRFVKGNETGSIQTSDLPQNWYCTDGDYYAPGYNNIYFSWTDPSGAVHEFPGYTEQPFAGQCSQWESPGPPSNPTMTGYAADGSGYYISVSNFTNATIYDSNGNEVYPTVVDRNGNYFSNDSNGNLIDTLGRTPVTKTPSGGQTFYDVLTIGGATKRYTVTTETINVHTAFNQSGVSEYSGSLTAIQSITLPDGSAYSFTYDSGTSSGNFGELESITLPTGGIVDLGYQNYLDSYQNVNRWLNSYSGGNGSYTFSPSVVTQCSGPNEVGCQESITAVDGNGNHVVYLLTLNNGAWNSQMDFYNGSSSHIMALATAFNITTSCNTYNCSGNQWITRSTTTTWLSDTNQDAYTKYTYAYPWLGKPTTVQMWDYYSGNLSNSPSGSPTKETDYTFGYFVNGAAFPTQVVQTYTNPLSITSTAQTVYDYDGANSCGSSYVTPTSGLPNHQSVSGARGNITCIVKGSGTTITTSSTYDDAGTKLSDVDERGNSTGYSSMCSDAYLQTVTYPVSVSGQPLQTKTTYDCPSGLVSSTQDMNGVVTGGTTTYQYFTSGANIGRLQSITYPDTGSKTYTYPSATETDQAEAQTGTVNVTSKSILDEFGRPYQAVKNAAEGAISSETEYDGTGRPSCVTTAHLQGTSSATDGSTCTSYDVLGRTTRISTPDGNAVSTAYSGPTQTVTDELTHNKKNSYDAFHHLTIALEPDSSGALNYETDYAYNVFDKLTRVDQWGGPHGSSGERLRQFAYDSVGRMVAESVPENQAALYPASRTCSGASGSAWTMCFSYDGNGNTTGTTDNAGNSITYTYDGINRVTKETYPGGSYGYGYDGNDESGNPVSPAVYNAIGHLSHTSNETNAASNFSYDSMGRLQQEVYCVPQVCNYSITVSALYDLAGNLTQLTYPDGRVLTQSYDSANRFTGIQYSKWISTNIGTPYYSVSGFAPPGETTAVTLGNGVGISSAYNSRQNVASIAYTNPSGTLWSKQFAWDKNNQNLLFEIDNPTSTARQFSYDTLNRVTSAQDVQVTVSASTATLTISGTEQQTSFNPCPPPNNPCWQTVYDGGGDTVYVNDISVGGFGWGAGSTSQTLASQLASSINGNGNSPVTANASGSTVTLTSKTIGPAGEYPISVTTSGWNQSFFQSPSFTLSAPDSLSGGISTGSPVSSGLNESYQYDPFGNLTQAGSFQSSYTPMNQMASGYNFDANGEEENDIYGHSLAYDANGMLTSVASGAETYVYDAQEQRVQVSGAATTEYVYFGGMPLATLGSSGWTDFIYGGNSLIAEVAGSQTAQPIYRVTDSIGSLQGDAPDTGPIANAVNYTPYGRLFSGSTADPVQFANFPWDSTTALWHAGYRQFSLQQGRWMSPDPFKGSYDLENPQSLSRYAYVNGNPLASVDPSGLAGAGILVGVGGSACFGFAFGHSGQLINAINPCNPVASVVSLYLASFFKSSLGNITNLAGGISPFVSAGFSIGCSFEKNSDLCGQSGWTSLAFTGKNKWIGTTINDTVSGLQALDGFMLHLAGKSLLSCFGGGPANPWCDVGIALAVYTAINDIISVILDFFGDSNKFHGSLQPRPTALSQSDFLDTLGVPINGANLDRQTHQSHSVSLPSPNMIQNAPF